MHLSAIAEWGAWEMQRVYLKRRAGWSSTFLFVLLSEAQRVLVRFKARRKFEEMERELKAEMMETSCPRHGRSSSVLDCNSSTSHPASRCVCLLLAHPIGNLFKSQNHRERLKMETGASRDIRKEMRLRRIKQVGYGLTWTSIALLSSCLTAGATGRPAQQLLRLTISFRFRCLATPVCLIQRMLGCGGGGGGGKGSFESTVTDCIYQLSTFKPQLRSPILGTRKFNKI